MRALATGANLFGALTWRIGLVALVTASAACFGSSLPKRSYFVLHGVTASARDVAPLRGLLRVRTLDAESIYEKFQIVVRRSPFELSYSDDHVWAVKPNQMVSDVIARALAEAGRFTSVAREYGEVRPNFILSGALHSIEIYDSGDLWFAHLALSLRLTRFDTNETLLTFDFDERKPVPSRTFSHAARAISELLSTAVDELIARSERLDAPAAPGRPGAATTALPQEAVPAAPLRGEEPAEDPAAGGEDEAARPRDAQGVLFVPEAPPENADP